MIPSLPPPLPAPARVRIPYNEAPPGCPQPACRRAPAQDLDERLEQTLLWLDMDHETPADRARRIADKCERLSWGVLRREALQADLVPTEPTGRNEGRTSGLWIERPEYEDTAPRRLHAGTSGTPTRPSIAGAAE